MLKSATQDCVYKTLPNILELWEDVIAVASLEYIEATAKRDMMGFIIEQQHFILKYLLNTHPL